MLLHESPKAGAALARAVELRPYDYRHRLYLARVYLFLDRDADRARAALEAAIRLLPTAFAFEAMRPEREALAHLEAGKGADRPR